MTFLVSGLRVRSKMKNTTCLITGVGGGLGSELTRALLSRGTNVIGISGKNKASLNEIIDFTKYSAKFHSYQVDVMEDEKLSEVLNHINDAHDVHMIINALGSSLGAKDPMKTYEVWPNISKLNFEIPVKICEKFSGKVIKSKGIICNIASISGLENHGHPAYCSAKAALIAYTRSIGRYLSHQGVAVFAVSPGAILIPGGYWDILKKENILAFEDFIKSRLSMARMANAEEIVQFIIALCDSSTPAYAGNNFIIDSGQGRSFL